MKYRKLRIAFSVTCGIACVLLVVLWVRSYSVPLRLLRANIARTEAIGVQSDGGRFVVGKFKLPLVVPSNSELDATLATDRTFATLNQWLTEEQTKLLDQSGRARGREWIAEKQRVIAMLQQSIAQYRAKVAMSVAGPQSIRPHALSVAMPHWLLLLVATTLAAIPWTNWRFRFDLRTLLIATTLVAVVLGLVIYATR